MKRIVAVFVFGFVLALSIAPQVYAAPSATFLVNQAADLPDANVIDGRCDTSVTQGGDQCSLRAAIQQSNSSAAVDTINFVSSASHFLTRAGNDDNAFLGDLDILRDVTIRGRPPSTTIDGNGIDRVFDVRSGTVTMSNLIVRGGHTGGLGGGYQVGTDAELALTLITVRENFGQDNSGGIENFGTLTLDRSTVVNNTTGDLFSGLASSGTLTVLNSTLNDNSGGDLWVRGGFALIINSTLEQMYAEGSVALRNVTTGIRDCYPGIPSCSPASSNIQNSILTFCTGTYISLGYNLIQDATDCNLTGNLAGNILNQDPQLLRFFNNGGPTRTRALRAASPAIDAGNPAGCAGDNGTFLTTDQRGFPRPTDGDGDGIAICDIGAFEVGAVGIGSVRPNRGSSGFREQVIFDLAWDSPTRWRDLTTLDLRFKRGKDFPLWLRFTEGLPSSTISLLDENGNVVDSGSVGEDKKLKNEYGSLDLAQSGFTASGPDDPHVVVHFEVRFKRPSEGRLKIQMLATDDFGNDQGPETAGKWNVENK
jgi:hypothetical protein